MMNSVFLLISILFAAIGYYMGRNKGRAVEGLLLGLILGVIGLIILAFLRPRQGGYTGPRQWGGFGSFRRYGGGSYGPGSPYGPGAPGPSGPYGQGPAGPYGQGPAGPYGQGPAGPYGQGPVDGEPPQYGRPDHGAQSPFGPPAWVPDPSGRFEYRWWDGQRFTEHVATGGVSYTDTP